MPPTKICYVVASEMTVSAFLCDLIRGAAVSYEVTVVANTASPGTLATLNLPAKLRAVAIERKIAPWRDLRALLALHRLFRSECFSLVHSVTPKAGLIAMAAGFLARVPVRVHTFTGQVWVTHRGFSRWLLKFVDRLTVAFSTHVLVDSPSQREFLLTQGVVSAGKSLVLGDGSVAGVDTTRFKPEPQVRAELRRTLGYQDGDVVFLYLGRMNRDKGVLDLAAAFARVSATTTNVHLLAVGPDEDGIAARMLAALGAAAAQAKFVGMTDRPQDYMAAADVFCLPSYREGFGTTVIEAAACGVPAIASRIYGLTDAVVDGVTGILHAPGDIHALTAAMTRLAGDSQLRRTLGDTACRRALSDYPMPALTAALLGFYAKILN